MASKVAILEIDGEHYQTITLETTPGLELYDELRMVLGESIQRAVEAGGDNEQIASRVLFGAMSTIPRGMLQRLGKTFAKTSKIGMSTSTIGVTWVEFNDSLYEQHFAGRLGHWTRWVIACLKHNFSDFLPASGSSPAPMSGDVAATRSA